ncbi:DUF3293 domain-containing protein [Flavobacterium sp.]|uniref:DUF3293 domain-containing protein n=1 Tax=Flavobacterium sp. TaxID=239 RepID=UPI0025D9A8B9|nr:DUF3293 domain-containing protein [Flavobacterium sp.]
MTNQQIHQAFLGTTYKVLNPTIDIKINTKITVLNHLNSWAFITAWNPLPEILTLEENKNRNNQLGQDINNLGLKYCLGIGISEDELWSEESFLIENITLEKTHELAVKYGQLAFVFGQKNGDADLVYSQKQ